MTTAEANRAARKVYTYFGGAAAYRDAPVVLPATTYGVDAYVVSWEGGPDEWVAELDGTDSESTRVMMNDAAREFGVPYVATRRAPIEFAAGIAYEPYSSFAVILYKETL